MGSMNPMTAHPTQKHQGVALDTALFPNIPQDTTAITPPCLPTLMKASEITTYRCGGSITNYYRPSSFQAFYEALQTLSVSERLNAHVIGWGSNTLIADSGLSRPCFDLRKLTLEAQLSPTVLRFATGVHLARVSHVAANTPYTHEGLPPETPWALSGLEGLVGIPGTVGGAVRMNAGAHGMEVMQPLIGVWVLDKRSLNYAYVSADTLGMTYRHTTYLETHDVWVLSADFSLKPKPKDLIQTLTKHHQTWRKTHHPIEPNGGSVFRNPKTQTTQSVGAMVDALGLKGAQWGGAMISPKHGNFIVNVNQASTLDVLQLMHLMKTRVEASYGVSLHPENKLFIEHPTPEEAVLYQALYLNT